MRQDASVSPVGARLSELLLPFMDAAVPVLRDLSGVVSEFRFVDAPATVVRQALSEVPSVAGSRPNQQPPASWLAMLAEQSGGRLCGAVNATYGALRVDAVCLPAEAGTSAAQQLAAAWPGQDEAAVAEGWSDWDAARPLWTGTGRDLRTPVPGVAVYSLWWD